MTNFGSLFYKPKRKDKEISAKRWNIFAILWKAIKKTCMVIGAMILISALTSTLLVMFAGGSGGKEPLPDDMVLVFKVENGIAELQTKPTLLDPFPFNQPTLRNIIDTLDKAKDDPRVRGLVFSLKGGSISISHTQELRAAITRFKASGKFTKIYAPSYTDGMNGLGQYYLASAFDEIWMQPVGMLSISGPSMEMPFAKDAFDKLGVSAQFFQREEFKSAMENFTNANMSEANKVAMTSLLNDLSLTMMRDVAKDRKIDFPTLKAQVDKGILTGKEGLQAKLLDRVDYADVMVSEIRKAATGDADDDSVELINLARYSQDKVKPAPHAKTRKNVALIYTVGTIVDKAGAGGNAGADEISSTLIEAYEDESVDVIVLRVDSPGGSPSASETIRRAVVKAKEKGKKIVVSMGPVAASGGYWIATDADKIFANSGTITGSIGVVMGKFEAGALWEKLGVNWEGPQVGDNADIWSINSKFDAAATQRMNVLIDDVYEAFVSRVAGGRGLSPAQVKEVARGRAWSGAQAKERGLVDEIGGLNEALDAAAKMADANAKSRHDVNIIRMPKERHGIELLLEMLSGQQVSLNRFFGVDTPFMKKVSALFTQAELVKENPATVYDASLESLR